MKSNTAVTLLVVSGIINIGLIVTYIIYVSNQFLVKPGSPSKHYVFDSQGIRSTQADSLIEGYKTSKHILKTLRKNQQANLFEFCFGADQIDSIININGSRTMPDSVQQVALYFGFDAPFNANTVVRRLIAYGMTSPYRDIPHTGGTLLDYFSGTGSHASIFETGRHSYVLKDSAEQSRRYYYTKSANYGPLYTFDYDNKGKELDGFSFNATQINQILSVEHPDTIAFAIGLSRPQADTSKIRWHIIAYGKKGGSPFKTEIHEVSTPGTLPASALYFDKADPCPKCVGK